MCGKKNVSFVKEILLKRFSNGMNMVIKHIYEDDLFNQIAI